MTTKFRIKVVTKTVNGKKTDTFYPQKKVFGLFWSRARNKDVNIKENVSRSDWIASFYCLETAKKSIDKWKVNLSKRVKKIKVGKPVTA